MAAPANTVLPAYTARSVPAIKNPSTVNNGTWTDDGAPTFTYQWQQSADGSTGWTNIVGEVAATITPSIALRGVFLRCGVTDTDSGGSTTAYSVATTWYVTNPWPLNPTPSYYTKSNWLQDSYPRCGIYYVGDTVKVPRDIVFIATDPATADFETGTNGAVVSSTDLPSHDPFTPFASGTLTYDNTHAKGTLSMKVSGTGKIVMPHKKALDGKTHHGRLRLYATANPSVAALVCEVDVFNSLSPQILLLYCNATGHLYFDVGARHTFTNPIPLNQWCRIEYGIVNDNPTGSIEIRLFQNDSDVSPLETLTVSGLAEQAIPDGTTASFGQMDGSWGTPFWLDDLVSNYPTWVGPGSVTFPTITHNYAVRDFYGNIVSSGTFTENECIPTPPQGGWAPGWYRIYFTGDLTDDLFGTSYGATTFAVFRHDSHFPTNPPGSTISSYLTALHDVVMKGVIGAGTSRLGGWTDVIAPTPATADVLNEVTLSTTYWTDPSLADPNRPRYLWANFAAQTSDFLPILNGGTFTSWGWIMCKDGTVDGSKVFITVTAGSVSGTKIKVFYPDAVTLVETYDNLADISAAVTAISGVSAYIVLTHNDGGTPTLISTPTAIGNSYFNAVKSIVSALYAAGVTYFEGPANEPQLDSLNDGIRVTQQMRLFQAAVKAGNPAAKAIGPCHVDIITAKIGYFLAAGGGNYIDEFSTHSYNAVDGDINIGRAQLGALDTLLASYGLSTMPRWQTESTQGSSTIGVFVPHKNARWHMWNVLLLEQHGFPRERNNPWYDRSGGFWSFDAFMRTGDGGLTPQAVLHRVLAEETWGKPFSSALDFGTPGNNVYLGSVYTNPTDHTSVVVLLPTSYNASGKVTLNVGGAPATLTAVDGFGNSSLLPVTDGQVTVPATEIPSYLRLPAGVSATVSAWDDLVGIAPTKVTPSSCVVGATSTSLPIDGVFMTSYTGGAGNAYFSSNPLPENATIMFTAPATIDRVMVWSGFCWQGHNTLIKFDVQTTTDGVGWTTQTTVDETPNATAFTFGADGYNTGTGVETFYRERWFFNVSLPAPVANCTGIRLVVKQTSYGGMPDFASGTAGPFRNFGVGQDHQYTVLTEVQAFVAPSVVPPPPPNIPAAIYPSIFVDRRGKGVERRDLWNRGFIKGLKG